MPFYTPPYGRGPHCYVTWRAKWLMHWSGEMSAYDWLGGFAEPSEPLPWNARVHFDYGFPTLYIGRRNTGRLLWPDGSLSDLT